MGSAYKELGDLDRALNAYQKATLIQPNHAFAYNNMGNIYHDKNHEKAIKLLKRQSLLIQIMRCHNSIGDIFK